MQHEITSIPELLIKHRGNQAALSRELEISRHTVGKLARDVDCRMHVVYNGVLMTRSKMKGRQGRQA